MSEPATVLKSIWLGLESLADRFAYPPRTAYCVELVNPLWNSAGSAGAGG